MEGEIRSTGATVGGDVAAVAAETAAGSRSRVPGGVAAVCGVALVAFNLRIAVTGVPPILDALHLGTAAQSVLVTIPVLAFSAGALVGPLLRYRLGEERAVLLLLALLAGGLCLRADPPAWALFLGTALAGLALAVLNVLLPSVVKRRFPHHLGEMMATYTTVMTIGASLAAGLTVPLLHAAGGTTTVALAVWAAPALLALVGWLPQLRVASPPARGRAFSPPVSVWRQRLAWQVLLFFGLQSATFYGSLSWLPAVYRDRGMSAGGAGTLLMVMTLVGVVGNVAAPMVAVRMRHQRPVVVVTVGIAVAGVLGVLLAPSAAAGLWVTLIGLSQGGTFSLALLLILLRSADSEIAAQLSSMAQSGGYLVATLGPLAMGLLHSATGTWTLPLLLLLVILAGELVVGWGASRDVVIGADAADPGATQAR